MNIVFFPSTEEFRQWLADNYLSEKEIIVGYYKVSTGKPSMTWSDSVDVALCYGWIDGVRRTVNDDSYCIRFTPRNPKSNWSKINVEKVERLISEGLMTDAGLTIYQQRQESKTGIYSFENEPLTLSREYELIFRQNESAWAFFNKTAPSLRKAYIHWIMTGKQEATRLNRLEKLISASEQNRKPF